jgi:hypothetical protein
MDLDSNVLSAAQDASFDSDFILLRHTMGRGITLAGGRLVAIEIHI